MAFATNLTRWADLPISADLEAANVENVTLKNVESVATEARNLLDLAPLFGDAEAKSKIQDLQDNLQEMRDTLLEKKEREAHVSSEFPYESSALTPLMWPCRTEFPPTWRRILASLANDKGAKNTADLIQHYIRLVNPDEDDVGAYNTEAPSFEDIPPSIVDWEVGTEGYQDFSEEVVLERLGLKGLRTFAYFNERHQPGAHAITPWSAEGHEILKNEGVLLRPFWHQLVGVAAMLDRAFAGKPVLLLDEVGVGKTMQVIGFISMITMFRDLQKEGKGLPGAYGMSRFVVTTRVIITNVLIMVHICSRSQVARLRRGWKNSGSPLLDLRPCQSPQPVATRVTPLLDAHRV